MHRREKEAGMLHPSFGRRPLVLVTSLLATLAIVALAFTPRSAIKCARSCKFRENMGGHSSLAFSYRILAKPLGTQERRLPMVALPQLRSPHHMGVITPSQIR